MIERMILISMIAFLSACVSVSDTRSSSIPNSVEQASQPYGDFFRIDLTDEPDITFAMNHLRTWGVGRDVLGGIESCEDAVYFQLSGSNRTAAGLEKEHAYGANCEKSPGNHIVLCADKIVGRSAILQTEFGLPRLDDLADWTYLNCLQAGRIRDR